MKFLKEISSLKKNSEQEIKESGYNFNLFNILDRRTDEVKTHSAFLGELLSVKGTHNKGDVFLKLFIKFVTEKAENDKQWEKVTLPTLPELIDCKTELEKYVGRVTEERGGYIDITLSNKDFIICIENKIDAIDQPNQLKRYNNFLKNRKSKKTLFYLTKFGVECSETELESGVDYFCLSYSNDIIIWLYECLKSCTGDEKILKTSIEQYIYLLKEITYQVQSYKMQDKIHEEILGNIKASQTIVFEFDVALKKLCNEIRKRVSESIVNELNIDKVDVRDTGNNFSSIFIPLANKNSMIGIESFNGKGHESGSLFIGKLDFNKTNKDVEYKYGVWYRNTIRVIWDNDELLEKYQLYYSGKEEDKHKIIEEIVGPICELYKIETENNAPYGTSEL